MVWLDSGVVSRLPSLRTRGTTSPNPGGTSPGTPWNQISGTLLKAAPHPGQRPHGFQPCKTAVFPRGFVALVHIPFGLPVNQGGFRAPWKRLPNWDSLFRADRAFGSRVPFGFPLQPSLPVSGALGLFLLSQAATRAVFEKLRLYEAGASARRSSPDWKRNWGVGVSGYMQSYVSLMYLSLRLLYFADV